MQQWTSRQTVYGTAGLLRSRGRNSWGHSEKLDRQQGRLENRAPALQPCTATKAKPTVLPSGEGQTLADRTRANVGGSRIQSPQKRLAMERKGRTGSYMKVGNYCTVKTRRRQWGGESQSGHARGRKFAPRTRPQFLQTNPEMTDNRAEQ